MTLVRKEGSGDSVIPVLCRLNDAVYVADVISIATNDYVKN